MKKYVTIIALLLLVQQASAFTLFDQLCAFNPNWRNYANRVPLAPARAFTTDREYIQAHLSQVLDILRSNPTSQLSEARYHSRLHLIALLDGYRVAGHFPINYDRHERIPVFIDPHQTHCAVGYLLQQTGHEDAARRIAAAGNYAWVKDIHDAELPEWQQWSGLSSDELKLIQGAYDHYMPNAFILPNKYEIPQKPACITAFFEQTVPGKRKPQQTGYIWCHGDGNNGVLHGRWEQNYAIGIPWIAGYFDQGKRTGQWMEYYQGTHTLCRTENWRDDKLNGVRKRFDRSGNLIEEIMFQEGNAITKTNYDAEQGLVWVRTPLDSTLVYTKVFTSNGRLLARGHEKVYNPGNLLWFQNIELTALNAAAITSRTLSVSNGPGNANAIQPLYLFGGGGLYNTPPLVEYKKEGHWFYYKNDKPIPAYSVSQVALTDLLHTYYPHIGHNVYAALRYFPDAKVMHGYDSVHLVFEDDMLQDFYGYGAADYTRLYMRYHQPRTKGMPPELPYRITRHRRTQPPIIMATGQYNRANERIGIWKHYNNYGNLYKTENYILPQKDGETDDFSSTRRINHFWQTLGWISGWKGYWWGV